MKTTLLQAFRRAFRMAQFHHQHPEFSLEDAMAEYERRQLDRRAFLRTSAQAGVALGLGAIGGKTGFLPAKSGKIQPKVAIVGAGISGLSAAYHLRRRRIAATIFEGDKRVGGRIKSARIFGNGTLNTEIGAEFIDTLHADMFYFARLLDLETSLMDMEQDTMGIRDAFFIEGRHYSLAEVVQELSAALPKIQEDQEQSEGKKAADWDNMPMAQYIDGLPVSAWVKKMLHAAYLGENGLETGEQSALNLLSIFEIQDNQFYPFGSSDERFKVPGGNEKIPLGLAGLLKEQIKYEHKFISLVENRNGSIMLTFSVNGSHYSETFDYVIMTLPFTVLRETELKMNLPKKKKQVIQELGYGTNAKLILETKERSWRTAGYRGYLFNERIPNGWDSTQMQQENKGMGTFTVYFGGERGKNAAKGTEQQQLDYILPALDGAFPGTKAALTGKMELAHWPGNPMIKGSYSCFKPGQALPFEGLAFQPVRHLFFAGEHTSVEYWGFMNGGAESGKKAAQELLKVIRV
jgi:monoamine oxidase